MSFQRLSTAHIACLHLPFSTLWLLSLSLQFVSRACLWINGAMMHATRNKYPTGLSFPSLERCVFCHFETLTALFLPPFLLSTNSARLKLWTCEDRLSLSISCKLSRTSNLIWSCACSSTVSSTKISRTVARPFDSIVLMSELNFAKWPLYAASFLILLSGKTRLNYSWSSSNLISYLCVLITSSSENPLFDTL